MAASIFIECKQRVNEALKESSSISSEVCKIIIIKSTWIYPRNHIVSHDFFFFQQNHSNGLAFSTLQLSMETKELWKSF